MKSFESLWQELSQTATSRPAGSKTVAELDKGVHEIGKKIIEEAGEVWLAAEHEGNADLAKENKEQHIFALESDAGGFTPRAIGISATSPEQFKKMQQWASLLKPYGTEITAGGGGADIGPLKNVNASIVLAGLVPDSQRYFDLHHAKTDVFENVNKRELLLGAVNMAAVIYLIDQYGTNL